MSRIWKAQQVAVRFKVDFSKKIGLRTIMKIMATLISLLVGISTGVIMEKSVTDESKSVFQFSELESSRKESKRPYLSFLNVDSMHCGIYSLATGAKDVQQPHAEDEIYYVEKGDAKINIKGKDYDLKKGSIIFVPAKAQHHFHSIKSDLKTLVFFSKGPVAKGR